MLKQSSAHAARGPQPAVDRAADAAPRWMRNWSAALDAINALDPTRLRREVSAFVNELRVDQRGMSEDQRAQAAAMTYEILRLTAERFTPSERSSDDRLRLIRLLTGKDDLNEVGSVALSELNRLLRPVDGRKQINPLTLRARRFIEEHSTETISLSTVARALGVAPNYLSTLFRRQSGMTLTEYIHKTRIEHAERLLHRGERPLSRVAQNVGYRNYRHFYRSFRRVRGLCPAEFVKRMPGTPA